MNIDVQEKIIMWTLAMYAPNVKGCFYFFSKYTVNRQPVLKVHLPELSKVVDIKKVNLRKSWL